MKAKNIGMMPKYTIKHSVIRIPFRKATKNFFTFTFHGDEEDVNDVWDFESGPGGLPLLIGTRAPIFHPHKYFTLFHSDKHP